MTAVTRMRVTTALILVVIVSVPLLAQSVLGQLGLTEMAARDFLFNEIKSPARARRTLQESFLSRRAERPRLRCCPREIMTWGGVRPWRRQGEFAHTPILLWIDGLDQS